MLPVLKLTNTNTNINTNKNTNTDRNTTRNTNNIMLLFKLMNGKKTATMYNRKETQGQTADVTHIIGSQPDHSKS